VREDEGSMKGWLWFFLIGSMFISNAFGEDLSEGQAFIKAVKASIPPKIDGILDDPCWNEAPSVDSFYNGETGVPSPERTLAYICYDSKNIYVAFKCFDREPRKIKAMETKRGGMLFKDDLVGVNIDPYFAHRETYFFFLNPLGTQNEFIPGGGGGKTEWKGDWRCAARINEDGWSAELEIPFEILRFPKGQKVFGISFERRIAKEEIFVSCPDLGPFRARDLRRMFAWGYLDIEPPKRGPKLMPYLVAYMDEGSRKLYGGLDAKYVSPGGTTFLLTLKPDFANVEQEVEGIYFTYGERFVMDRRPFFTEGSGGGLGPGPNPMAMEGGFFPPIHLFYSMRIGEIDGGLKIFGRSGPIKFGLMDALKAGSMNAFAASMSYEIGSRSEVKCGLVHYMEKGIGGNPSFFVRGSWGKVMGRREIGIRLRSAISYDPEKDERDRIGRWIDLDVTGGGGPRTLGFRISLEEMTANFNPRIGFIPESGMRGIRVNLSTYDQPKSKGVERWDMDAEMSYRLRTELLSPEDTWLFDRGIGLRGRTELSSGFGFRVGFNIYERPPYKDIFADLGMDWNRQSLYSMGSANVSFGRRGGGDYFFLSINQGARFFSKIGIITSLAYSLMKGPEGESRLIQAIGTFGYDISPERGISGRILYNPGEGVGGLPNFYFSYRQSLRRGLDLYLIVGDPNANSIRYRVAIKALYVFQ
jgi:hypothetical protein